MVGSEPGATNCKGVMVRANDDESGMETGREEVLMLVLLASFAVFGCSDVIIFIMLLCEEYDSYVCIRGGWDCKSGG